MSRSRVMGFGPLLSIEIFHIKLVTLEILECMEIRKENDENEDIEAVSSAPDAL